MPDSTPVLEVDDVTLSFGGVHALRAMNLTVATGESAALIGPNGSGKSTLVNVISRMIDPASGAVRINGTDITRERCHRVAGLGIARTFQHVRLVPELTLRENVAAGAVFHTLGGPVSELRTWFMPRNAKLDATATDSALDLMEVPAAQRDNHPRSVSFALQRQTEMARAMAGSPKIVLLDEPAAGMNPSEVLTLLRLLGNIHETGAATVLIDHNMDFVMQAAKRVTVINRGERIAFGTADEVRRDPAVIEAYLGAQRATGGEKA
jgi:ABC-type branched-subunit amino acid transport system ATPase component